MPEPAYNDADIDAAIEAITAPDRLREAQDLVARAAPSLQRALATALDEGGWFDSGHQQAIQEASEEADPGERLRAIHLLLAEETRLGMLVGVAVGFELARELDAGRLTPGAGGPPADTPPPASPKTTTQEDNP